MRQCTPRICFTIHNFAALHYDWNHHSTLWAYYHEWLFAMSEIALVSARKARLESQALKGDKKAKEALELANHPESFISTVQLAITLITFITGIFSGKNIEDAFVPFFNQFDFIRPYSANLSTVCAIIIITYFSLVFGELVPKRIGLSNPEGIAKIGSAPMRFISDGHYLSVYLVVVATAAIF